MTQSSVTDQPVLYFGLDVGDRHTHLCCLDDGPKPVRRLKFPTTREGLAKVFGGAPRARIALEVGSQSPWMSRFLRGLGHDVVVADARRVAQLVRGSRKTDRRDAETLAQLLRGMPQFLGEVHHRSEAGQADMALIRARDVLVKSRTKLVQHVRGVLKSVGLRVRACSAESFDKVARPEIPGVLKPALEPLLDLLEDLRKRIRAFDKQVVEIGRKRYPETLRLRQISGVGSLTSLAFVLTLGDALRFSKSRKVGSWLGMVPRVQASGDKDPALPISKAGSIYMRSLLTQSAHYILGPFGEDCDLRRFGLRLCERGGKAQKGRAVVAVARKLAVLMHRLLLSDKPYEPLRNSPSTTEPEIRSEEVLDLKTGEVKPADSLLREAREPSRQPRRPASSRAAARPATELAGPEKRKTTRRTPAPT